MVLVWVALRIGANKKYITYLDPVEEFLALGGFLNS